MKYKVGDEFLIKITDINERSICPYVFGKNGIRMSENILDLLERTMSAEVEQTMTAEEAWEIAKKILLYPSQGGFNATELEEIFGQTEHLWEMTPKEIKSKIEAWEAAKEIKVGDVVEAEGGIKAVVMDIQRQTFGVFTENGCIEEWYKSKVVKTRHHIDIDGLLKQVRGNKR